MITLDKQREMEHQLDMMEMKYLRPVEVKCKCAERIVISIMAGIASGLLIKCFLWRKKKKVKEVIEKFLKNRNIELSEEELEKVIKDC